MFRTLATGTFYSDSFEIFTVAIVMDLGVRNRIRDASSYWAAKSFILGAIVIGELLSLGAAAAQVRADSSLPAAPSTTKHVDVPASVFALPQDGSPPQVPATPSPVPDRGLALLLKRGARDQKGFYTAPFHRRNLKWDLIFLAGTGGLIAADKQITGAISHNNLSTSQHISDAGLYGTIAATGALLVSGVAKNDEHAREAGFLGFEAAGNTLAITAVAQIIAGRERPLEGFGHGRFWVNNSLNSSFPSVHSSLTWSIASALAHEYHHPWVQFLAYGTATTVSVTRVTGLKHFPADVAVGGVAGYVVGGQIFHRYSHFFQARRYKKDKLSFSFAELPDLE